MKDCRADFTFKKWLLVISRNLEQSKSQGPPLFSLDILVAISKLIV